MRGKGDDAGGPRHVPVLAREVVAFFAALPRELQEGWIVDGTLGLGGHTAELLDALPNARVLGVDQDEQALTVAKERLARFGERVRFARGRMSELDELVQREAIEPVAGFLFDVGVSSLQLDEATRGFSFQADGPLDMRMDRSRDRNAADIVNRWDESDLADLFYYEGEETRARVVARAIVDARRQAPFLRTLPLADLIARAIGRGGHQKIHPATRVFQALRRAVNEEGDELLEGLSAAGKRLAEGGRLVVISFHSLEDAEVKQRLSEGAARGLWKLLTKKPVVPGRDEVRANPRSRSARLRAAERLLPIGPERATRPLSQGGRP
ncbi:MAG: 16S rRNA (cytosine(1402)-N(4))-methyltransferase RsmH [Planctomycetes bacterium]|nr:16S rRNA (cytosine(1402)-N(4))-methyltransferase RsmH [Planctomycetota bacterium]